MVMVRKVVRWGIVVGLAAFGVTLILGSTAWVGSVAMVPTMLLAMLEMGFKHVEELKKPTEGLAAPLMSAMGRRQTLR
jgi:hypothetical protein